MAAARTHFENKEDSTQHILHQIAEKIEEERPLLVILNKPIKEILAGKNIPENLELIAFVKNNLSTNKDGLHVKVISLITQFEKLLNKSNNFLKKQKDEKTKNPANEAVTKDKDAIIKVIIKETMQHLFDIEGNDIFHKIFIITFSYLRTHTETLSQLLTQLLSDVRDEDRPPQEHFWRDLKNYYFKDLKTCNKFINFIQKLDTNFIKHLLSKIEEDFKLDLKSNLKPKLAKLDPSYAKGLDRLLEIIKLEPQRLFSERHPATLTVALPLINRGAAAAGAGASVCAVSAGPGAGSPN